MVINPLQVWQDVYLIGGPDLTHIYDCQVYLIDCGELVLIDSGAGESFEALVSNIRQLRFDPQRIAAVIATHSHIDHIGALGQFQQKFSAQVIAHQDDAAAIESGENTGAALYGLSPQPARVDRRLKSAEERLDLGRHQLHALHIPGHTPGSLAVYVDMEKRLLFGQDVHGPYVPEWGADLTQAAASLKKLRELGADILCEGHYGIIQPAPEVRRYIEGFLHQLGADV